MTKDEMKKVVCQAIDEAAEKIHETVLRIESEPELGYKEMKTAAKVESYMKELGLMPQTGLALTGVKTCVDGGKKGPAVAVLAELDAVERRTVPKRILLRERPIHAAISSRWRPCWRHVRGSSSRA